MRSETGVIRLPTAAVQPKTRLADDSVMVGRTAAVIVRLSLCNVTQSARYSIRRRRELGHHEISRIRSDVGLTPEPDRVTVKIETARRTRQ